MSTRMPFQNSGQFLGLNTHDRQPFVVVGVPFDGATSYRPGTRMAPQAIRQVSHMLTDGVHPDYPVDLKHWVGDAGDWAVPHGNTVTSHEHIYRQAHVLMSKGYHLVCLGGDHSITLPLIRAVHHQYGQVGIVHLDAHCDTWSDHFGEPYGHGTWLRDVIEESLVDPQLVWSIGVRSATCADAQHYLAQQGGHTITAQQAMAVAPHQLAAQIQAQAQHHAMYLTVDIDCLDPSHAPGTGTPEIGGVTTMWVQQLLSALNTPHGNGTAVRWVGMDCVEVAPAYDHSDITSLAAASFVWQHLSHLAHNRSKNP